MNKTISKTDAKQLLKAEGLKLADYAAYLDIKPQSLSARWTTGQLHIVDTLAVQQYAYINSQAYNSDQQYTDLVNKAYRLKDDPTVAAQLKALQAVIDNAD